MQYQRHNFAHNFLNAVGTDKVAAWDILVNEINEIVLEYPKEVETVIRNSNMRLHSNPSPKDMVDVIHDGIYVNKDLRKKLVKLIAKRHADPHYAADGGPYDKVLENPDLNSDGDLLNEDGELINFVNEATDKLFSDAGGEAEKKETKKLMTDNLAEKEKQKSLPVSSSKIVWSNNKKIAVTLGVIAAIGLISFIVYKTNKPKAA